MFDAHCHLQFEAFDDDRDAVLAAAARAGLRGLVIADYDADRRPLSLSLADRDGIWATAGIHPWAVADHGDDWLDDQLERLEADLDSGGFCAVGELGLDRIRCEDEAGWERQMRAFRRQLALARERDLPIVVHAVRATQDCLHVIAEEGGPSAGGMLHGFSGSAEEAERAVDLGLFVSIGSEVTRRNARRIAEVVGRVGLKRITVETDAPDRPPEGVDEERSEPRFLHRVVERVAAILETDPAEVAEITEDNVRRLFRLEEARLSASGGSPDVDVDVEA